MKQLTIESIEIVHENSTNFQKFTMKDAEGNEYVTFRAVEPKQWLLSHAEAFRAISQGIDNEEMRDGLVFIADTSSELATKF